MPCCSTSAARSGLRCSMSWVRWCFRLQACSPASHWCAISREPHGHPPSHRRELRFYRCPDREISGAWARQFHRLFQATGGCAERLQTNIRLEDTMPAKVTNIRSRDGGKFDCYLVTPESDDPVPAIVLASAVHGVDADIRAIADEFAAHGSLLRRPTCSGVGFRGRFPTTMTAPASARSHVSNRSRSANAIWRIPWRISAHYRNLTGALRRWASATAALTRSSGRSASATPLASPATERRCWTTSKNLMASVSPSALSGPTKTLARRSRCWTLIEVYRRA